MELWNLDGFVAVMGSEEDNYTLTELHTVAVVVPRGVLGTEGRWVLRGEWVECGCKVCKTR